MLETDVRRGARLLDEKRPGWAEKVDVAQLNMASASRCVLGQVAQAEGTHYHGLFTKLFNSDSYNEVAHGLALRDGANNENWAALKAAWVAEIEKRVTPTTRKD